MAEENLQVENTPQEQVPQERQLSAIEQKAIEQGWRPKEEFDGDEAEFIDAPEFVRRGELFTKIEHQSKELKQVRQALEALKTHHSRVKETEYTRALKELEAARKQALVEGEHDRFFALEEKIDEIKEEKAAFDDEVKKVDVAPSSNPNQASFENWLAGNSWYNKDRAMRVFADSLGQELRNSGVSFEKALTQISAEVRKEFSHKFQNQKASRPSAVEAPARNGKSSNSFQLSDDERNIMRKFVRAGVMSEQEYIAELKKTKGV